MKAYKIFFAMLIMFTFEIAAQQQGDYSKEPGYFDLGELTSLKSGEMITEVYLEEPLLKMVAKMGESEDKEIGNMIGALKLVKVNEFMIDKNNLQKFENTFEGFDKTLASKKWNRIIKTKHNNTNANVYVKNNSDDSYAGLVIVALDKEGKVTLVNIVGNINLETVGKLSKHLHFPDVQKMKDGAKDKEKVD